MAKNNKHNSGGTRLPRSQVAREFKVICQEQHKDVDGKYRMNITFDKSKVDSESPRAFDSLALMLESMIKHMVEDFKQAKAVHLEMSSNDTVVAQAEKRELRKLRRMKEELRTSALGTSEPKARKTLMDLFIKYK